MGLAQCVQTSIQKTLASIPEQARTPAYDADRQIRPGAWVAEVTDGSTWLVRRRAGG